LDSGEEKVLLALAVALEGGAGSMRLEDVEFDREPELRPIGIELKPLLNVVHSRLWQSRLEAEL